MSQLLALTDNGLSLLSLPRLRTLNTYFPEKQDGQSLSISDISVAKEQPLVLQWYNDQKTVEALSVKVENGKACMVRVKKLTGGSLRTSSYAIPKVQCKEIAVGYASGHIRIVHLKTNTRTKTLNPEISNNPVAMMDFNCNDDYIGVLYDNGSAGAFNLKTAILSEKLKVKGEITFLKYHGTKGNMIGAATLSSNVIVWDTNRHVALYNEAKAHDAPIRDLCWNIDQPDYLYTASYDCKMKIYDIRKRACAMEIKGDRPLNCLTVSSDGNVVLTGNLACVINCYDVRNSKQPMAEINLSRSSGDKIKRLSMLSGLKDILEEPEDITDSQNIVEESVFLEKVSTSKRTSGVDSILAEFNAIKAGGHTDSFIDSIDDSSRIALRKSLMDRRSSVMSTGGRRISDVGCQNLMKFLNFSSETNVSGDQEFISAIDDSHVNVDRLHKRKSCPQSQNSVRDLLQSTSQRKSEQNISSSRGSSIEHISITGTPNSADSRMRSSILKEVDENLELRTPKLNDNKENIEAGRIFPSLPKEKTSTPNIPTPANLDKVPTDTPPTVVNLDASPISDINIILSAIQSLRTEVQSLRTETKAEIQSVRTEIQNMRTTMNSEMANKFLELTQHYNSKSEDDKWHIFQFVFNNLRRNDQFLEDMDEAMGLLVRNIFQVPTPMKLNVPED